MRKIVFALSVVLTAMTACEDNHTLPSTETALPYPFPKFNYRKKVPMKREYLQ